MHPYLPKLYILIYRSCTLLITEVVHPRYRKLYILIYQCCTLLFTDYIVYLTSDYGVNISAIPEDYGYMISVVKSNKKNSNPQMRYIKKNVSFKKTLFKKLSNE